MRTFNDNAGRTWTVDVNVGSIKRVKTLLGVNLLDAIEGKLIEQFVSDPVLLCDVIYAVCQPEAEAKEITDEQFGQAMAGDAIDGATTALLEELVDFFPNGKRQVLAKALSKLTRFQALAIKTADKRLDDPKLDQQLERLLQREPSFYEKIEDLKATGTEAEIEAAYEEERERIREHLRESPEPTPGS